MKKTSVLLVGALLILSSCVAGANPSAHIANEAGDIAGFWLGLLHGVITPVTFVISLFWDNVHIYEVHNSGALYNFGFLWGAGTYTALITNKLSK